MGRRAGLLLLLVAALGLAPAAVAEPGVWSGSGPPASVIAPIAIDPLEPRTVYGGGFRFVYRSDDGARSWRRLAEIPEQTGIVVSVIPDPATRGTVYVVAGATLWRSTTAGESWQRLPGDDVAQLAIAPGTVVNPTTLLAATYDSGLRRSTDAGATWIASGEGLAEPNTVYWVAVAPTDASTAYLLAADGLYRSTDTGRTWTRATLPVEFAFAQVVDPSDPDTLYVAGFGEVHRSRDGGTSWTRISTGLQLAEDGFVAALAAAPTVPTTLYAVTDRALFRSTSAGDTWSLRNNDPFATVAPWTIAVDPSDPELVYRPTGEGVLVSDDGGATFRQANAGLPGLPSLAVAGTYSGGALAGTLYSGLRFSPDGGASWTAGTGAGIDFETILSVAAEQAPAGWLYAGSYRGRLYRSADGTTWETADGRLPRAPVWAIAPDPSDPGTLLAATEVGVYRSANAGERFRRSSKGLPNTGIRALAFAQSAPSTVYAGLEKGGVARSANGGRAWVRAGLRRFTVISLAVDPTAPETVFAATRRDGVHRSTDGGRTWTKLMDSSLSAAVAVDPVEPGAVLVASGSLVLRSLDGGESFASYDAGLPESGGAPGDPEADYPRTVVGLAAVPGGAFAATMAGVFGVRYA